MLFTRFFISTVKRSKLNDCGEIQFLESNTCRISNSTIPVERVHVSIKILIPNSIYLFIPLHICTYSYRPFLLPTVYYCITKVFKVLWSKYYLTKYKLEKNLPYKENIGNPVEKWKESIGFTINLILHPTPSLYGGRKQIPYICSSHSARLFRRSLFQLKLSVCSRLALSMCQPRNAFFMEPRRNASVADVAANKYRTSGVFSTWEINASPDFSLTSLSLSQRASAIECF